MSVYQLTGCLPALCSAWLSWRVAAGTGNQHQYSSRIVHTCRGRSLKDTWPVEKLP